MTDMHEFRSYSMKEIMGMPPSEATVPDEPLTLKNIQQRFPVLDWVFGLAELFKDSHEHKRWQAYAGLKNIAIEYVGHYSPDKNYRTSRSYDLVLQRILDILNL